MRKVWSGDRLPTGRRSGGRAPDSARSNATSGPPGGPESLTTSPRRSHSQSQHDLALPALVVAEVRRRRAAPAARAWLEEVARDQRQHDVDATRRARRGSAAARRAAPRRRGRRRAAPISRNTVSSQAAPTTGQFQSQIQHPAGGRAGSGCRRGRRCARACRPRSPRRSGRPARPPRRGAGGPRAVGAHVRPTSPANGANSSAKVSSASAGGAGVSSRAVSLQRVEAARRGRRSARAGAGAGPRRTRGRAPPSRRRRIHSSRGPATPLGQRGELAGLLAVGVGEDAAAP